MSEILHGEYMLIYRLDLESRRHKDVVPKD